MEKNIIGNDDGWSDLESDFIAKDHDSLIMTLSRGVNPNCVDDCGSTLLMHACGVCDLMTIAILLVFRSDPCLRNREEETALSYLCSYNDEDENRRISALRIISEYIFLNGMAEKIRVNIPMCRDCCDGAGSPTLKGHLSMLEK